MPKKNSSKLQSLGGNWVFVDEGYNTKSADNPNEKSNTTPPQKSVRHPKFFFDNVLIAIEIEGVLFNVHRYQLVKGEVFSDMFDLPKPEGHKPEEGSSPEHPIIIKGVAASDFAALLTVLYASHFSSNQPPPEATLVVPAFRLANMFKFPELCTYLLPLVEEKLDDVEKIVLSREFDIKEWLVPSHIRLCLREKPLNAEEARKLGVESVLIVWRMREQHRIQGSPLSLTIGHYHCSSCAGMDYCKASHTCDGCDGAYGVGHFYFKGPREGIPNTVATIGSTAIEAGVKKWVEDGCTLKD